VTAGEENLQYETQNIGLDWQKKGDYYWVADDSDRGVYARVRRGPEGSQLRGLYWVRIVVGEVVVCRSPIDVSDGEGVEGFKSRLGAMQWCEAKVESYLKVKSYKPA
jgi:hypothetical protein